MKDKSKTIHNCNITGLAAYTRRMAKEKNLPVHDAVIVFAKPIVKHHFPKHSAEIIGMLKKQLNP